MATEVPQPPKRSRWRRVFGEPQSWRRMISIGIGAGVALAVVAALIASGFTGGSSPLDNRPDPTSVVSGAPVDGGGTIDEEPTELPVLDTPTEAPLEEATEEPVATEGQPTDAPVEEATPTEVPIEEPTEVPTVAGGA